MKILISVDMEGISGVSDPDDVIAGSAGYERARALMIGDAAAAALGAFDASASEVIVTDAHGSFRNLPVEAFDSRVRVMRGSHAPLAMMHGIDAACDAVVFIGYHAKAGTPDAVLCHSFRGHELIDILIDDRSVGELEINALIAGEVDVPVVFVSGDNAVCTEARRVLGAAVGTAIVKTAVGKYAALCDHPDVTRKVIRDGVARATSERCVEALRPSTPVQLTMVWQTPGVADLCALVPTVRRPTPSATEITCDSMGAVMAAIVTQNVLAASVIARNPRFE